jgi:hypothetical protein
MSLDFPFSARISVPDGVLVRDLDGESVVLNLQTEKYYGLDAVGTRMWAVLTTTPTIQSAYEALLQEYDVEPERLGADLRRLIGDLLEHGLLLVHE